MKKVYLLFALLLSLFGATTMFAQEEVTIQVDMDHGKWVEWNGSESNPYARTWNSTTTPAISICCKNGGNSTTDIRGNNFYGANNMTAWGDGKKLLSIFNQYSTTGYGNYEIMVDFGWFIKSVEFDFNSSVSAGTGVSLMTEEEVVSSGPDDTQHVSVTIDDEETYAVPFVVYQKGTNGFAQTSNFYVVVGKQKESVTALEELVAALASYESYHFLTGTEPGNYGETEVAAFNAAIVAAHDSEDNPDLSEMPDEELAAFYRSLAAEIKSTYEAVLASRNTTYTLADGYYRIKTGMQYYTTETITDEETQEETTVTTLVDKYMTSFLSGENFYAFWETPENECDALWKITNKDGYVDIQNMATDARFNSLFKLSTAVSMSLTSENLYQLDPAATYEGTTYVNIRKAPAEDDNYAADGYWYFHQYGHSSGAGTENYLVLWSTGTSYNPDNETPFSVSGSEWVFEPVADEEAEQIIKDYEPVKDLTLMKERYKVVLADATEKMEIARDIQITIDDTPLITDAAQLSSPYTEESEGSIEALLDGNTSTYWHSDWTNDTVTESGIHYLQAEIAEADVTNIVAVFTRRPVAANHVTKLGVYGTNDPEAEKANCEELATLNTPFSSNTETITTAPFDTKGYKYIRFYVIVNSSGNYIMHMSEFQLYKAEVIESATTQAKVMGDIFTNLETVIDAQKDIEIEDLTLEEYNALKNAYDAFIAVFVDPTALRSTLSEVQDMTNIIAIGDQPGFWSADNNVTGNFKVLYDEAVAYDVAGAYTAEKSQYYIDALTKESEDIYSSANPIQTGKWYRIRFANEEEFEKYGWDTTAGEGNFIEDLNSYTSQPLFGKYITASRVDWESATYVTEDGTETTATIYETEVKPEASSFGVGSSLVLDDKDDINASEGLDLFRFIAVGDSAFIMQNKGTNLFLKAAGTSGAVTLSAHPTLFNVRAIGYGENVIAAKNLTGESQNYLHGQVAANLLVTWNAYTPGSRSGLYIEEAEDVASDYEGTEFNVPIVYGSLNSFCYPIEITATEGQMWSVSSVDPANNSLTLFKIEKADAGRPFIFVYGETEDYNAEEEAEMIKFTHNYTIGATEPQTKGFLKGTYEGVILDRGDIYASDNALVINTVEKDAIMVTLTRVYANQAYISAESKFDPNADLVVVWDAEEADGIQTALQNISHSGAVYTVDGRLVSKKATINDLSRFGKGLYILNGTKVVVK